MHRRKFIAAAALGLGRAKAGPREEIIDLLARMATALGDGRPAIFLEAFDPAMPGYARLRADVFALADQAEAACSVRLMEEQGDERSQAVELDWLLELRGKAPAAPSERRQARVRVRLERRGKQWKIVSLEPAGFFTPPGPQRR